MQLKTASAIAIAGLSIQVLLSLAGAIWTDHQILVMGIKTPWYIQFASLVGTLLFHGPLILFFVVLYRNQNKNMLSR